jgi:hypothetical protein
MAQHKWHKEIKAWADGAEIEWLSGNEWLPKIHEHWNVHLEYRIKSQPKEPQYLYVYDTEEGIKLGTAGSVTPIKNLNGKYKILGAIKLEGNDNGND